MTRCRSTICAQVAERPPEFTAYVINGTKKERNKTASPNLSWLTLGTTFWKLSPCAAITNRAKEDRAILEGAVATYVISSW